MDSGEIVVFQDSQGKLKTNNVSLDDVLIRRRDVIENTMALYSNDGKLKPGVLVSTITDTLNKLDKELEDHIRTYTQFRRNLINKFFAPQTAGASMVISPAESYQRLTKMVLTAASLDAQH